CGPQEKTTVVRLNPRSRLSLKRTRRLQTWNPRQTSQIGHSPTLSRQWWNEPVVYSWFPALLRFLIPLEANVVEELHRRFGYFLGVLTWDNNHAVPVCHYNISGTDEYAAQVDRAIYRLDFITARAESAPFSFVVRGDF